MRDTEKSRTKTAEKKIDLRIKFIEEVQERSSLKLGQKIWCIMRGNRYEKCSRCKSCTKHIITSHLRRLTVNKISLVISYNFYLPEASVVISAASSSRVNRKNWNSFILGKTAFESKSHAVKAAEKMGKLEK